MRAALVIVLLAHASAALASPAAPPRGVFALIVTNNRSLELGRPDLHYADDDGAKYYELFRMVAPEGQVRLLTAFDRDTERLFPQLREVARSPTKRELATAVQQLMVEMRRAQAAGQPVDFYFVYAGHGDVDRGRGFLELRDGPFNSDDLERLLRQVPANRSHVILDSCNSFFVLNARKPGGRRFATPADAARSLATRLPNVGVFLSTSAQAEVFEWSELQSGIFSHAVRSGLAGAADANGDGLVSYAELAGFVGIAASKVRNPLYRPKVFARGPMGAGADAIMALRGAHAAVVAVEAEGQIRLTVRDRDGLPWIDVFKEAGLALKLHLPAGRAAGAVVEELAFAGEATRVEKQRVLADAPDGPVALAALALALPGTASRGPGDLFRALFARPFGPRALARYEAEEAASPREIFGVSGDDTERMRLLLAQVADEERGSRRFAGVSLLGAGALLAGFGAWYLRTDDGVVPTPRTPGYLLIGLGAGAAVGGVLALALPSSGERLYADFVRQTRGPSDDMATVVADTELRLEKLAADYRWTRWFVGAGGAGFVALGATMLVLNERTAHAGDRWPERIVWALPLLTGAGVVAFAAFKQYPVERMASLWRDDPGIRRLPRLSLAPLPGGAMAGLGGTF